MTQLVYLLVSRPQVLSLAAGGSPLHPELWGRQVGLLGPTMSTIGSALSSSTPEFLSQEEAGSVPGSRRTPNALLCLTPALPHGPYMQAHGWMSTGPDYSGEEPRAISAPVLAPQACLDTIPPTPV